MDNIRHEVPERRSLAEIAKQLSTSGYTAVEQAVGHTSVGAGSELVHDVNYYVSFRCGGRHRHVVELHDDGWVVFSEDAGRGIAVEPEDLPRVIGAVMDVAEPDEIRVTRRGLSFLDE